MSESPHDLTLPRNSAEERVLDAIEHQQVADLSALPDAERELTAGFLQGLISGAHGTLTRPLRIRGARINGPLRPPTALRDGSRVAVQFQECYFDSPVDVSGGEFLVLRVVDCDYYSLSRLLTEGTITIGDEQYDVTGNSWMDHEFSTSALGDDALGWDWFGLILDNDTELMVGQVRQTDGGKDNAFGGLMIYPDGSTHYLSADDIQITANDTWVSPHTDIEYPSGWTITVRDSDQELTLDVTPLAKDQELNSANIRYWEGAVEVSGDATGYGYAELTGYDQSMQGRF